MIRANSNKKIDSGTIELKRRVGLRRLLLIIKIFNGHFMN